MVDVTAPRCAAVACDEAAVALGVDEVGIAVSFPHPSTWGLVEATGPLVRAIDDEQFHLGIGPVPAGLRTGAGVHSATDLVSVDVIDHHATFLARSAERLGVGAVYATAIPLPMRSRAVMEMVRRAPGIPIDLPALTAHVANISIAVARDIGWRVMYGAPGDHWVDRFGAGHDRAANATAGDPLGQRLRVIAAVDLLVTAMAIDRSEALARLRGFGFRVGRPVTDLAELLLAGDLDIDDLASLPGI